MRLINADRLKKSFEANTPIAFQDCVPGINAIIDLEPTVEAIPIDFIMEKIYLEESVAERTHASFFWRELIEMWRSENDKA